jgi:hypothetical protein
MRTKMNPLHNEIGGWARSGAFLFGMLAAPLWAQPKIAITSPSDGVVVHPGSSVTVTVAVSPAGNFRMVTLSLGSLENGPAGQVLTAAPYSFTVQIPRDIGWAGGRGITAVGVLPDQLLDSDPIVLDVERSDPPLRLEEALGSLPFGHVGESSTLLIYGTYADGSKVDLTHSSLTKYTSASQAIVKIDSHGRATAAGPGSTSITVENSGAKVVVPVSVPHEEPPVQSIPR